MEFLSGTLVKKPEKYLVGTIVFLLFLVGGSISFMPKASLWPIVPGFIAICGIVIFFASLQTAFLLYSQSKLNLDSGISILACGYLWISFLALARTLFLPGILFSVQSFPENTQIAAWLWIIWHVIFPLCVIFYCLVNLGKISFSYRFLQWVFRTVPFIISLLIIVLIQVEDLLPSLIIGGNYDAIYLDYFILSLAVVSFAFLTLSRGLNNRQDLWLILAVTVHGFDVFYGILGSARYSMGWYMGMISSVISSSIILSIFIYEIFSIAQSKSQENLYLKDMSEMDPLTGIANRRKFNRMFENLWQLSLRQQKSLCLILIDIDHFKLYNDSFGHPSGDRCLIKIARALSLIPKRKTDFTTRMGGEEFAILLYGVSEKIGNQIAEETRKAVELLGIPHLDPPFLYVTISVGCGTVIADATSSPEEFFNQVDQALFKAKAGGRNRVKSI